MDKEVDDMPHGWPTQPRLLGQPTLFAIISNAVVDILSIAASLTFLAFVSVVLHCDSTLHTVYDENEKPGNLSVNRLEALLDSNYTFYNSTRAWRMNGTASRHADIIIAHKGWVTTLGIASIVLLFISLIPPTARQLCNGPPLEVNLSNLLTRHNPYISLSSTGTSVEADDRARWLKDLRVQFGDVESQANIGSLAIGRPVRGERDIERVQEGRLYE
jgi:hypothetical protein